MGPLASLVAVNVQGNPVPKIIDFPRYYTKFSGENEILRGVLRIVSNFSLHFVLYIGNLNSFLDRCEVQRSHHQQPTQRKVCTVECLPKYWRRKVDGTYRVKGVKEKVSCHMVRIVEIIIETFYV